MLHLKRMRRFNEFLKCKASGKIMMFGDFYYEDDEDGSIIDAKYYHELKRKRKEEEWDYSELDEAKSQKEYAESLKKAEEEYLSSVVLDEYDVAGKPIENNNRGDR